MLEPTTLLTASSLLPASEADTLTAVSGSDVPIATIVSPIIIDGTCSLFATLELPSTKKSAPLISSTNPITRNISTSANGALLMNFSISFLPFIFYNSTVVRNTCYYRYLQQIKKDSCISSTNV
jgi:hypothetical protein